MSVLTKKLSVREAVSLKLKSLREKRAEKSVVVKKKCFINVNSFYFSFLILWSSVFISSDWHFLRRVIYLWSCSFFTLIFCFFSLIFRFWAVIIAHSFCNWRNFSLTWDNSAEDTARSQEMLNYMQASQWSEFFKIIHSHSLKLQ